jgi:alkylated DNA repair dioxygenase AlkB
MGQLSLLGSVPGWRSFDLPDADVRLLCAFLSADEASSLFQRLRSEVPWRQDTIKIYGKEHLLPRLQQWFGDAGLYYTWSGIRMVPLPWIPALNEIRRRTEEAVKERFNTALLNLYRNGDDTVSWHSDDERTLGPTPIIASVSLGAERDFVLRHRDRADVEEVKIALPHGSLLLMQGRTQAMWKHALPRRRGVTTERINLTFRRVAH